MISSKTFTCFNIFNHKICKTINGPTKASQALERLPGCRLNGSERLCPRMRSSARAFCAAPSGGGSGAARAVERVLNQIANDDEDTIEKEEQDQREQP